MQIIKSSAIEKASVRPSELPPGTVYTWGIEKKFFMVCARNLSVCLNDGSLRTTSQVNADCPVRIVKGAFHVED